MEKITNERLAVCCESDDPIIRRLARELAETRREGWVMVPREPTQAMVDEACELLGITHEDDEIEAREVYRAMLAAAPKEGT